MHRSRGKGKIESAHSSSHLDIQRPTRYSQHLLQKNPHLLPKPEFKKKKAAHLGGKFSYTEGPRGSSPEAVRLLGPQDSTSIERFSELLRGVDKVSGLHLYTKIDLNERLKNMSDKQSDSDRVKTDLQSSTKELENTGIIVSDTLNTDFAAAEKGNPEHSTLPAIPEPGSSGKSKTAPPPKLPPAGLDAIPTLQEPKTRKQPPKESPLFIDMGSDDESKKKPASGLPPIPEPGKGTDNARPSGGANNNQEDTTAGKGIVEQDLGGPKGIWAAKPGTQTQTGQKKKKSPPRAINKFVYVSTDEDKTALESALTDQGYLVKVAPVHVAIQDRLENIEGFLIDGMNEVVQAAVANCIDDISVKMKAMVGDLEDAQHVALRDLSKNLSESISGMQHELEEIKDTVNSVTGNMLKLSHNVSALASSSQTIANKMKGMPDSVTPASSASYSTGGGIQYEEEKIFDVSGLIVELRQIFPNEKVNGLRVAQHLGMDSDWTIGSYSALVPDHINDDEFKYLCILYKALKEPAKYTNISSLYRDVLAEARAADKPLNAITEALIEMRSFTKSGKVVSKPPQPTRASEETKGLSTYQRMCMRKSSRK